MLAPLHSRHDGINVVSVVNFIWFGITISVTTITVCNRTVGNRRIRATMRPAPRPECHIHLCNTRRQRPSVRRRKHRVRVSVRVRVGACVDAICSAPRRAVATMHITR